MRYAIIGPGNVGTAIARAVTEAGHQAVVAGPSEDELRTLAGIVPVATTTSNVDAVSGADVVVLAVPFAAVNDVVTGLRAELAGKTVLDATNPQTVMDLLAAVGFRPIDVGGLSVARYLEGMGFINIALNARNDWSWQSGWKLVGPLS